MRAGMATIRRIESAEPRVIDGLCALLIDAVHDGASVGFLAPLSHDTALCYWKQALASPGDGLVQGRRDPGIRRHAGRRTARDRLLLQASSARHGDTSVIRLAGNLMTALVALAHPGFLAAGLVWGLAANRCNIKLFFLGCVIVAGIFGGLTAKTTNLFTQALPGAIAFLLVIAARSEMRDKMP